jgi:F0F1-type ATP synthase delta subunit
MKVTALTVARAFVDVAKATHRDELPALADAAVALLASYGLLKAARTFPALVERVWQRGEGVVPVKLTTVSGDAGEVKEEILHIVKTALKRPCVLEEHADPSVLGGMMLSIEDERFDATLRGALSNLAEQLTAPIPLANL